MSVIAGRLVLQQLLRAWLEGLCLVQSEKGFALLLVRQILLRTPAESVICPSAEADPFTFTKSF